MTTNLAEVHPTQDNTFPALLKLAKTEIEKTIPYHLSPG